MDALGGLGPLQMHHTLGNHCLALPRKQLLGALQMPASYYAAPLAPGWRLLVLDTTDMSPYSGYGEVNWRWQGTFMAKLFVLISGCLQEGHVEGQGMPVPAWPCRHWSVFC